MLGGARIYPKASEDVSAQDEREKCKYCYPCDIRGVCCLTLTGTDMHFEVLVEVCSRPWGLFQAILLYLVSYRKRKKPTETFVQLSFTQLNQAVFDGGPKTGRSPLDFKMKSFGHLYKQMKGLCFCTSQSFHLPAGCRFKYSILLSSENMFGGKPQCRAGA